MNNFIQQIQGWDVQNHEKQIELYLSELIVDNRKQVQYYYRDYVTPFNDVDSFNRLLKEYVPDQYQQDWIRKYGKLSQLQGYYRVRGDGNCFYNALFYQYLQYILFKAPSKEVLQFIDLVINTDISIILFDKQQQLPNELNTIIKQYFLSICFLKIRQESISNFSNYYTCKYAVFYWCSIIIIRSIVYKLFIQYIEKSDDLVIQSFEEEIKKQLITWQQECNYNEIIIQSLSNSLQIQITMYKFDKSTLHISEYGKDYQNCQIILLFRPGHYQIGF